MAHTSFTSEEDYFAAFDEYADAIFRHCYLRTQSREKAKDMTQGAFRKLWDFIAAGNYVDSMKIFLYRASHQIIEADLEKDVVPGMSNKQPDAPDFSVFETMQPDERPALILHYVDGFSLSEIGAIVGGSLDRHAQALSKGNLLLA